MGFFGYRDPRIQYFGRWAEYQDSMTATAPGSRFTLNFSGEMAVLVFNVVALQSPVPHLYIRVDGGAYTESTLERYIRICTAPGKHTVEVILKSAVEAFPRWHPPLTNRISFEGIETDSLNDLPAPAGKILEILGDSITEGELVDPDHTPFGRHPYDFSFQNDVTATYGWLAAKKLGLTPYFMGYGGMGVTHGGGGGVEKAADIYPYCFAGTPIAADYHPDYVLINEGTNDHLASPEEFKEGYALLLDTIRAAHPRAKIFAMSTFRGVHEKSLEELVPAYNAAHDAQIVFINGSHWLSYEPLHPLRDGHQTAAEKLAEALRPLL